LRKLGKSFPRIETVYPFVQNILSFIMLVLVRQQLAQSCPNSAQSVNSPQKLPNVVPSYSQNVLQELDSDTPLEAKTIGAAKAIFCISIFYPLFEWCSKFVPQPFFRIDVLINRIQVLNYLNRRTANDAGRVQGLQGGS
jgi:hypothetical protein